jgi:Uma2 family endonuclease
MPTQYNYYLSPKDYLELERKADIKIEYIDGVMYQMAGGSESHNLITGNTVTELNINLRKSPCKVYPSDMKVGMPKGRRFYYPDVSVVCGEVQFADDRKDIILNPMLIVEVLSDGTAAYDRGKQFLSYQQIESLQEYVLISQDEYLVERFIKQSNGDWLYSTAVGIDKNITFTSINCTIALADIYAKTT